MEHSLHLGAGHFVRGVTPMTSHKILKKVKHVVQDAYDHGAYDLDQLDAKLEDIEDGGEDGNGDGDGNSNNIADDEDSRVEWHGGLLGRFCLLIFLPFISIFPTLQLKSSPLPLLYFTYPLIHFSPVL